MQLKPVENLYLAMDEDGSDVETYTAWTDSDGNIDNTEAYSNGTTKHKQAHRFLRKWLAKIFW